MPGWGLSLGKFRTAAEMGSPWAGPLWGELGRSVWGTSGASEKRRAGRACPALEPQAHSGRPQGPVWNLDSRWQWERETGGGDLHSVLSDPPGTGGVPASPALGAAGRQRDEPVYNLVLVPWFTWQGPVMPWGAEEAEKGCCGAGTCTAGVRRGAHPGPGGASCSPSHRGRWEGIPGRRRAG